MASRKKQSEGIALLSMYNDEDDDEMEEIDEEEEQEKQEGERDNREPLNLEVHPRMNSAYDTAAGDDETSTPQLPPALFNIVDYGEIDIQHANDDFRERTPMATEPIEHLEQLQLDTMSSATMETEAAALQETVEVTEEADPLDKFLPPPPKLKCSEELQRKIDKFLGLKRIGKSFNAEVRNRKDYRNPDFLLHAVRYQDIDQIGSCFSKHVFDPHGYEQSDYYEEIEADMKREKERKDQENKKNQKVEFIPGGVQPGLVAAAPKPNIPITGLSAAVASGFHPVPTATDAVSRDGRHNKKSKWDKVDGDPRNPRPSMGQDSLSAVGAHAATFSAANAGAGYTAFAQQRRREVEERKSSERKFRSS
ncbi:hypothetical protein JRO89_XS06G0046400 [Xanthoceras sorbifolium]|uniref:SAP30-binding protein n=1 Tax=Xanthoceras sorbifolium TaxID=99658 RepID=A0ABQ8HWZ8_9ROSI|nr:hypothetical protein JRO89_XS06G0046400 [Xanthoceras sorbifolium]